MSPAKNDSSPPTNEASDKACASIVLCGGRSQRMGTDKALITFEDETLLQRTCRTLGKVTRPVVVVAAPLQTLPKLPDDVTIVRDEFPDQGPLGGLLTGLQSLKADSHLTSLPSGVFVCGCDSPFLSANVIAEMQRRFVLLDPRDDCLLVTHEQQWQPLHSVYRLTVGGTATRLFESGVLSLHRLLRELNAEIVTASEFVALDPKLLFLRNVNTPDDLASAKTHLR